MIFKDVCTVHPATAAGRQAGQSGPDEMYEYFKPQAKKGKWL